MRFLAVLELYKRGALEIEQIDSLGALTVRRADPDGDVDLDLSGLDAEWGEDVDVRDEIDLDDEIHLEPAEDTGAGRTTHGITVGEG